MTELVLCEEWPASTLSQKEASEVELRERREMGDRGDEAGLMERWYEPWFLTVTKSVPSP